MGVTLTLLAEPYVICRMDAATSFSFPDDAGSLYALTRTKDELSLVCAENHCPDAVASRDAGWSALMIAGPLDFGLTGILASIAGPLAAADISLFAVSTYDTDYVLVRTASLDNTISTLHNAGHTIHA